MIAPRRHDTQMSCLVFGTVRTMLSFARRVATRAETYVGFRCDSQSESTRVFDPPRTYVGHAATWPIRVDIGEIAVPGKAACALNDPLLEAAVVRSPGRLSYHPDTEPGRMRIGAPRTDSGKGAASTSCSWRTVATSQGHSCCIRTLGHSLDLTTATSRSWR